MHAPSGRGYRILKIAYRIVTGHGFMHYFYISLGPTDFKPSFDGSPVPNTIHLFIQNPAVWGGVIHFIRPENRLFKFTYWFAKSNIVVPF